jgi:hypothetical protein
MSISIEKSQEMLQLFERGNSVADQREAIIPILLRAKKSELIQTPEFQRGLAVLLRKIEGEVDSERTAALSLARRLAVSINVRGFSDGINAKLESPISRLHTPPSFLENPDDRRYLGEALGKAEGSWIPDYLAAAAVGEPPKSNARIAFLASLLRKRADLSEALDDLAKAFEQFPFETKDVGASRARRLSWTLSGLRLAIANVDPTVQEGVGRSIAKLISAALGGETINDRVLQRQLATDVLILLHDVVRLHFSLATGVDTFAALQVIRRIFPGSQWPTTSSEAQLALARLVREALVLLAKQGIADDKLRQLLIELLGQERAASELHEAATKTAGVQNDFRTWLIRGQFPKQLVTRDALEETILAGIDRTLSLLLLNALSLSNLADRLHDDLLAAIQTYDPRLQEEINRLNAVVTQCAALIQQAASARALRTKGRSGEVVDFNATEHESPADGKRGRRVRLRTPVVERAPSGLPPSVIVKADVDVVE